MDLSHIENSIDDMKNSKVLLDIKRDFITKHRDIIKCEPSGMYLNELEDNKITKMRLVD